MSSQLWGKKFPFNVHLSSVRTNKHKFCKWALTWQNQQNHWVPSEDSDQPGYPRSLIRVFAGSKPGSATYFRGDLSWNNFYGYSPLPLIQEGKLLVNHLERLSLPRNSVVRLTTGYMWTNDGPGGGRGGGARFQVSVVLILEQRIAKHTLNSVLKI